MSSKDMPLATRQGASHPALPALEPCPFCGCEMNRVAHSAFHRTDSTLPASCWLATAGEFGGAYELNESDYPAWNRRSCNSHAALVKALETAASELEMTARTVLPSHQLLAAGLYVASDRARAALALATKET